MTLVLCQYSTQYLGAKRSRTEGLSLTQCGPITRLGSRDHGVEPVMSFGYSCGINLWTRQGANRMKYLLTLAILLLVCMSCTQQPADAPKERIRLKNASMSDFKRVCIQYGSERLRPQNVRAGETVKWACDLHPLPGHVDFIWTDEHKTTRTNRVLMFAPTNPYRSGNEHVYELHFFVKDWAQVAPPQMMELLVHEF